MIIIVTHAICFSPFNYLFDFQLEVLGVDYCAISIAISDQTTKEVLTIGDARHLGKGCYMTDELEIS